MMFAAVVTIIGALLTILALAGYLIFVALVLRRVDTQLGQVLGSIGDINRKAGPVGPVIRDINKALGGVDAALQGVLAKERQPKQPPAGASGASGTETQGLPRWVVAPQVNRSR